MQIHINSTHTKPNPRVSAKQLFFLSITGRGAEGGAA